MVVSSSGTIGRDAGMVAPSLNSQRRPTGFVRCWSTPSVPIGRLKWDSHLAALNEYLMTAATKCFYKQSRPKKGWISDQSMRLVRQMRAAVHVWTELKRRWRWLVSQRAFAVR